MMSSAQNGENAFVIHETRFSFQDNDELKVANKMLTNVMPLNIPQKGQYLMN